MENQEAARLLEAYAEQLGARGEGGYRRRAYLKAAAAVADWPVPVEDLVRQGADLRQIPGVGPGIAKRLQAIVAAGGWPGPPIPTAPATRRRPSRPRPGSLHARLLGDLHTHTDATDGRDSLAAMAGAARDLGYEYVAVTDHSQETRVAGGLSPERMRAHLGRIRRLDGQVEGITVLAGAEVDILKDGRLDFPDSLLMDLDVVVCSVHFRHKLDGRQQTERILRGMANEHADILGHPTGRRLGIRPGMELDLPRILDAARGQGWAVEMNGSPERLDLDAGGAGLARERGVMVSLDSDAHSMRELAQVRNCCRVAEAVGMPAENVLNALPLDALRKRLA
jgi:histidinol phosphatase-like PHP family hydrolase